MTPDNSLSFLPVVTYGSGYGPFSVAVADVNGDGKPDLVATNYAGGAVAVLLGNGDGTFQAEVTYGSGGSDAMSVAIADVNADGKRDLVVSNSGAVGVLLGNGDGTFQAAVAYGSGGAGSVAVADVNGDGKADVLVVSFGNCFIRCTDGSVGVLLGNGDGSFQSAVAYDSGAAGSLSVAVADVNGDGKPDLVVASDSNGPEGTVSILLGNGDGTFQGVMLYGSGGRVAGSVVVADVNGDGRPDLLVSNYCGLTGYCTNASPGVAGVLLGNGDGTFQAAQAYDSGGYGATSVAVGDVNGDGKPDLMLVNECGGRDICTGTTDGTVGVLLGNGDGTFQTAATYDSGGIFPYSLVTTDLNGDGKLDLVFTNYLSADIGVLLNNTPRGKSTTTTSLASSLNPSIYGQTVTWTATVTTSGSVPPTGTVNFNWGGGLHSFGTGTLNSLGVATLTRSTENADAYAMTAVYSGDGGNSRSTSAILNQVITQATSSATLASSPNPSAQGQAVTFTATITSPTCKPTGPVTFTAGKTVLGTAQLANNKAKFTISTLAVGSTTVTATYYGDSNISASSASVLQSVH
jgi:hypothetical protein